MRLFLAVIALLLCGSVPVADYSRADKTEYVYILGEYFEVELRIFVGEQLVKRVPGSDILEARAVSEVGGQYVWIYRWYLTPKQLVETVSTYDVELMEEN